MYLFGTVVILLILFFACICHRHRKKLIKKICFMHPKEKREALDELIAPFGYSYLSSQDVISSRIDAWQREFGYHGFFDKAASYANIVIDALPVYFDYRGQTWLIEFWKGQYGVNAGCEIGVYYADRILREQERATALFHCVNNEDMLKLSFTLSKKGMILAKFCAKHWWLTAFCPGRFAHPADLVMNASITFFSPQMARAFANALPKTGYGVRDLRTFGNTVSFTFGQTASDRRGLSRFRIRCAQCFNRLGCRLYLFLTKPFCTSIDRLLYLYYYLPSVFRKLFHRISLEQYRPPKKKRKRRCL